MKKRPNDTPHRRIFKKANGRAPKRGYHIHHIDGDWTNNSPENLAELSPLDHFQVHFNQEDWGACVNLARVADISVEELIIAQREHGLQCVERGIGIHNKDWDHQSVIANIWKNHRPGRKPVTDGTDIIKFKTDDEVEQFLSSHPNWRRGSTDRAKQGLKKSNRRITSEESTQLARQRLVNGTHNFITEYVCPHCGKVGKGPMMKRWHFDNCNLLTNTSIPLDNV